MEGITLKESQVWLRYLPRSGLLEQTNALTPTGKAGAFFAIAKFFAKLAFANI